MRRPPPGVETPPSTDPPPTIPAAGWRRFVLGPRVWWQEAVALFVVYQVFERLRGILPEPTVSPFQHAYQLIRVQKALGIFVEATVQQWFLPSHLAIQFFDIYYGTIHFVIPPVALILLWRRDQSAYRRMRNSAGFMLVLAFVGFALWPLAPPRLLPPPYRFVDTAATIGGMGPLDRGNLKDDNQVAAMPSLHIGWSSWCALALVPVLRRRWSRALIICYPFLTLIAVVVTANHYLLDGVGGLAVLAGGLVLEWMRRWIVRARVAPSTDGLDREAENLRVSPVDGGLHP